MLRDISVAMPNTPLKFFDVVALLVYKPNDWSWGRSGQLLSCWVRTFTKWSFSTRSDTRSQWRNWSEQNYCCFDMNRR